MPTTRMQATREIKKRPVFRRSLAFLSRASAVVLCGMLAALSPADNIVELDELAVRAEAQSLLLPSAGAASIGGALEGLPGTVLNMQGGPSGQVDLSIRGSSFSGAGLSVAGLALRNPQTEHFHAELPLSPALFARPDTLTGLDQALRTSGHLVGTLGLEFRPARREMSAGVGVGDRDRNWQDLRAVYPLVSGEQSLHFGVFGGREFAGALDYGDNELDRRQGGFHVQMAGADFQGDVAFGVQSKDFGARGYYGVTPDWDAEERIDDRLVVASLRWGKTADSYARCTALWRDLHDRYRLFWSLPGVFENRHHTRLGAVSFDGRGALAPQLALNWRVGGEYEDLDSNALGNRRRSRGDALLLPEYAIGRVRLHAGARGHLFSRESSEVQPQAGCELDLVENQRLFASYTEGVRRPSFTELNYDSPGSLGNQGLERQETAEYEIGWRGSHGSHGAWQLSTFHRRSRNTVDWIKQTGDSPRWLATDLGTVETWGVDLHGRYAVARSLEISGAYGWLHKDYDPKVFASRYVLDYPAHLVQLSATWWMTPVVRLAYSQLLRWQEGLPARQGDDFGAGGRAALTWAPQAMKGVEITLACDNVWDDDFETYVGQPVTGRRAWLSLAYTWL